MIKRRLITSFVIAAPIAYGLFWFFDLFVKSFVGGQATYIGFPIGYYYDNWSTPGIEFNQPWIQLVNFMIYYIPTVTVIYIILKISTKYQK